MLRAEGHTWSIHLFDAFIPAPSGDFTGNVHPVGRLTISDVAGYAATATRMTAAMKTLRPAG